MIPIELLQPLSGHAAEVWMFEVFDDFYSFVTITVTAAGVLGAMGGRSMAVGALSAYLVFAQFAVKAGDQLLENILYVTLVLILVGMAFKFWRLEGGGGGQP